MTTSSLHWTVLLQVAIVASIAMLLAWTWQRRTRNAGVVDVVWATGMALSAVYCAWVLPGALLPRVLVGAMGASWGLRLATHLGLRVFTEAEDGRYAYLRKHWNGNQRNFLLFFQAQALFILMFTVPFWAAAHNPVDTWTVWTVLAIATWLLAVGGESLADRQLSRHREDPSNRGKTLRSGLWRYSRHPNYFFEFLHWFAYVFLAVGAGWLPVVLAAAGPLVMLAFLYRVTGIPFTEAQALRSRGDDYAEYQRTTSPFVPWPPDG